AVSSLKVMMQVLSRSAFDISQPPSIELTASLGGAPVWAAALVTPATTSARTNKFSRIRTLSLAPRRPRRLRHRRERLLAGRPGDEIVDDELVHRVARGHRAGADVRQQHDVVHRQELGRNVGLVGVDVEPGGENLSLLEGGD